MLHAFTLMFRLPSSAPNIAAYMEPLQTDLVPDITSVSRRQHFLTLSCRLKADTRCESTRKTAEAAIMALLRAGLPHDIEAGEVIKLGALKGRRKVYNGAL